MTDSSSPENSSAKSPAPALPSASVILVRDNNDTLEVLLVQRNANIKFHGGAWVFPGGKVDEADRHGTDDGSEIGLARVAAIREVQEEAGVSLDVSALRDFSHWLTPIQQPKRFSTWFFIAPLAADTTIQVDASEIVDHIWLTPEEALARQATKELTFPPPTFVSLTKLQGLSSVKALDTFTESLGVEKFAPKIVENEQGRVALYAGDAGFDAVELEAPGARHRLNMLKSGWYYEQRL
ncbi:MAG: NUDIX hydrolase [Pseudomonadota bacterium]